MRKKKKKCWGGRSSFLKNFIGLERLLFGSFWGVGQGSRLIIRLILWDSSDQSTGNRVRFFWEIGQIK